MGARQTGRANGSRLYSWATCSPVMTLRIRWSPLSCTRERTQGRPEVPARAAPPHLSVLPSRHPPGSLVGAFGHRGVLGGELLQLGRVPGHGLGQQAAEPHVVLGHLALAGVGDRDVRRPVLNGQDRRGVLVSAAADVGAGGQPDYDWTVAVPFSPNRTSEVAVMPSPPARRVAAPGPPAP